MEGKRRRRRGKCVLREEEDLSWWMRPTECRVTHKSSVCCGPYLCTHTRSLAREWIIASRCGWWPCNRWAHHQHIPTGEREREGKERDRRPAIGPVKFYWFNEKLRQQRLNFSSHDKKVVCHFLIGRTMGSGSSTRCASFQQKSVKTGIVCVQVKFFSFFLWLGAVLKKSRARPVSRRVWQIKRSDTRADFKRTRFLAMPWPVARVVDHKIIGWAEGVRWRPFFDRFSFDLVPKTNRIMEKEEERRVCCCPCFQTWGGVHSGSALGFTARENMTFFFFTNPILVKEKRRRSW